MASPQKVRITLCEKGLDWESIVVDLFRSEQYNPHYVELNPKGVVPTLIHDAVPIIQSTLICEYLDDVFLEPRLVPADPLRRTEMRLWSKAVDEGLHEGITEISFSAVFRERMKSMPTELREARFQNIGDPRRRDRFKSTYDLGVQSPFVLYAISAYERAFDALEKTLAGGGPWILGAEPTLADVNLMPYVARLGYLELLGSGLITDRTQGAWWAQTQEWPSFKRGLHDRVTENEFAEMRTHGPNIRDEVAALLAGIR